MISDTQILLDTFIEFYLLTRARCDVCQTKTWHYCWQYSGLDPRPKDPKTGCIEHSMADEYDRYRARNLSIFDDPVEIPSTARQLLKRGQNFEFTIQYDPSSPFIKWAKELILKPDE